MTAAPIPFFRAGQEPNAGTPGLPIGFMSGVLIFDSGEADNTFLYRCQDRYLTYNALAGLRSLLFVADDAHRRQYLQLIDDLNARLARVSAWTGVPLPSIASPLLVPLNADTLSIGDAPFVATHVDQPGVRESLERGEIVFNQSSPTGARLLLELQALLDRYGIRWHVDADRLRAQAALSLWCHDKANYVDVVSGATGSLPPHIGTAVLSVDELFAIRRWADLADLYEARAGSSLPPALYVKSTFDSGGNVAMRIEPRTATAAIETLQREVQLRVSWDPARHAERLTELEHDVSLATSLAGAALDEDTLVRYLERQSQRRSGVRLLVQEAVDPPSHESAWHCEGLGITCALHDANADVCASAGQIYADADRRHFIGSFLSDEAADLDVDADMLSATQTLGVEFTRRGYEGPLNFDARRDRSGRWVFIYDCNPRLSAIYPALAVRSHLAAHHPVTRVMSLGYRGEFSTPDLDELLGQLSRHELLYSATTARGALPLPSIAREGGCDFALVNMESQEVERFVRSPVVPKRGAVRMSMF